MSRLSRIILSGGLSREEYEAISGDVVEENRKNLTLYAPVASVAFCLLTVASHMVQQGPPSQNSSIYLLSCVIMAILTLYAHHPSSERGSSHSRLVLLLTYAFLIVLHAFSVVLSMSHPEFPAVSAIVFLMVNPLLFVDRPIRAMAMTTAAASTICVTSALTKSADLALDDIWNAVTFGVVALAVDTLIMRTKLVQLFQARKIAYLSSTDTLTKLRNRNNYESRLESYPQSGAKVLVCAYADANGLRELNNSKGHDAGDELLRSIAREMRKHFGAKNTYRIGGDEFVAIVPDSSANDVRRKLQRMQARLDAKGYSVSCGAAEVLAQDADMRALVREAEKEMYAQKQEYHAGDNVQVS